MSASSWSEWSGSDGEWDALQLKSRSMCVYQTSSWANHRNRFGWTTVRVVHESGLCSAQILCRKILGTTIAWVPGGPIGDLTKIDREFLTSLKKICRTRAIYLRVNSLISHQNALETKLLTGGFRRAKHKLSSGQSLLLDLSADTATREERLSKNWSRNLRRGESRNTRPYLWSTVSPGEVATMYEQMAILKDLQDESEFPSLETVASLVENCADYLHVIRCDDESGKPLAIRGALVVGENAWDIFAAVSLQGRKQYSSYVTAWQLFNHCAEMNVKTYDLSGVDPINNKGVYDFKHGTGANEISYLGEWEHGSPFFVKEIVGRMLKYRKPI